MRNTNFGLRIADCELNPNTTAQIRNPRFELRSVAGFTYIALLAAIVIIGISMTAAGKYWRQAAQREKEEELLFRGNQYRIAIERYFTAMPGRAELPQSIEALLKDDRFPQAKRHLRQPYKDPITGGDFEVVRDMARGNRITGVYSMSDKKPVKQADFPDPYSEFQGKNQYSEWKFMFKTQQPNPAAPLPAR